MKRTVDGVVRAAAIAAALVLCAAVAIGAEGARNLNKDVSARAPVTFTVASYNINYGNPNLGEVYKAIVTADADVVCLQETNRSSEAYLRRRFREKYRYTSFIRAPRHAAGGYGFLSKAPLMGGPRPWGLLTFPRYRCVCAGMRGHRGLVRQPGGTSRRPGARRARGLVYVHWA